MKDTLKDALNEIDDTYIAEAAEPYRRNSMVSLVAALAAMLVLMISVAFALGKDPSGPVQMGSHATSSTKHVHVSGNCPCGWSPFFPSTSSKPITNPTLPPSGTLTIPLANFLQQPEKITGLQQIGSRAENPSLAPTMPYYSFDIHMVIEARVKQILPGVYQDPLTKRCYHILKMETLDVVSAENMPQEFYLRLSTHLSTDLHIFTSLVLSIQQVGIENYLLINQNQAQMEAFSLLFELYTDSQQPFFCSYGDLIAFSDGVWDQRLYKMKGWEHGDTFPTDYPVGRVSTIAECKARILEQISKQSLTTKKVYTSTDIVTGTAQEEFLEWVKPFANGVYAQKFYGSSKVHYTRLINSFQTNEIIHISQDEAYWVSEHFTQEDLSSIPDLGAFMMELQSKLETMYSPHMDFYKDKEVYLKCTWAEGKYYKVNGQIYGLVKVCWAYWTNRSSNAHKWPGSYIDAMYYLISADGSYVVAQRDEIAKLLGEDFLEREYDVLEPFPPI